MHPSKKMLLEGHVIRIMELDQRIRDLQGSTSTDLIGLNDAGISKTPKAVKDKVENAVTNLLQMKILNPGTVSLDKNLTNGIGLLDLTETITAADDPLYRARANMIENGRLVAYARSFWDLGKRAQSLSLAGPAAAALGTCTIVGATPGIVIAGTVVALMQYKAMANIARQLANLKNYQKMDELIEERHEHVQTAKRLAGHLNQEKAPLLQSLGKSFKVLMKQTKTGNPKMISTLAKGKSEDLVLNKSSIDLIKVLSRQNDAINRITKEIFNKEGDLKFPAYAAFDDKGQATIRYTEPMQKDLEDRLTAESKLSGP